MIIIIVYRIDPKGNKTASDIFNNISHTPPRATTLSKIQIQQIIHRFVIRFINLLRQ